jgi:arginase
MPDYSLISAPSPLGLWPSGVQDLGRTLLDHGLDERLSAPVICEVRPATYVREKDPVTGYLNGPKVRAMAVEIAGVITSERARNRVPLILGGDCSVMHGALLALRRSGRAGLFYLDGHGDFYDGSGDHSGEIADMGLAIATGHNHPLMSDIDGLSPYIRPDDAVAYGFRDEAEAVLDGSPSPRGRGLHLFDLPRLRAEGRQICLSAAIAVLTRPGIETIWIHFDTDVIDDQLNPAVDYPLPGGLHWDEAAEAIRAIRMTGRMAGLSVSIFNPRKDPDGRIAMALTDCLVAGLRG